MFICQVKFREIDTDEPNELGGILVDDGLTSYVICGCCGGVFSLEEVDILEKYDDWNDLSAEIMGDE